MSTETSEYQKPSSEPLNVPKLMREGVKRSGGNPDLMLKEHPEMVRKPRSDAGKSPGTTR